MIEKRTTRSQNCKQFQLQQQPKLCSQCDVLPPPKFDFSFADPAFCNIYELLKVTHLYLCATHSSVSSSLLHILQQFEQLAAHTTSTVAKYAVQTIKPSMIEQIPSTLQSSDCIFSKILVPSADSTFCSAEVLHETISSLLDHYPDQLELNFSLLEQNLQLSSQFHVLKGNLAICENHKYYLALTIINWQSCTPPLI